MVGGKKTIRSKTKNLALLTKCWPNSAVCTSKCVRLGKRSHLSKMNLIMVPQSCQKEKVNKLKVKTFLIGHIYEVKIISINKLFVMPIIFTS